MPVTAPRGRLRALALLALLLAGGALAQDASMTLYVFRKGLPQRDVEVLVDGRVVGHTDASGVVVLSVPPGLRRLELRDQDLLLLDQQVLAHQAEISQWIVNVTRGLSTLADVESSSTGALAPAAEAQATEAGPGILRGRLVNVDGGGPVAGARVYVSGRSDDLRSGEDGRFEAELPAGSYSVSVLHASFNTLTRDGIEVPEGDAASLELQMTPSGSELPEFVVLEPYIAGSLASVLEERRTEVAVANILGAEQMSKAGDSDAASALRRVTGLTLVGGRFIYVRGLGERYSSTLLNGANLPSPDPTRRVVPLDLFPTGIVDSIAVQKGYTADLPAEFGGGTVGLRTKRVPEAPFLSFEASAGYRDGTTGEDGLRYEGSSQDWTGRDGGIRQQPDAMVELIGDGARLQPFNRFTGVGFTAAELESVGDSLAVIYDATGEGTSPNLDASASGGYVWETGGGHRIGFLAATEYKDEWLTSHQHRTQFVVGGDVLVPQNDFEVDVTLRNIDLSAFLTTGWEFGENHSLAWNTMLLRNTTDRAQVEQGFNVDAQGGDVRFTELEWVEREMNANQFLGEHVLPKLGGLKIGWQYTDADAGSEEPDTRRYRFDPDQRTPAEDDFIFSLRNDSNQRRWGVLDDQSRNWNLDLLQPLPLSESVDIGLTAGLNKVEKDRESELRRFSFLCKGRVCNDLALLRQSSLEDIINPDTIAPTGWQLEEVTNATDSYTGSQEVDAWYAGLDFDIAEVLRLAGGVRQEESQLTTTTFNLFDPARLPVVVTQETDDLFPYATATWVRGDHQLRAGWAETINRPDFKELSPSQYRDPLLDRIVRGNPDLQPAYLTHWDLRWDYYFNPGEFISLGVFLKQFDQPIELVILASAGDQLTTFENAETAENLGIEFELYKTFDFLHDWWGWGEWLGRFYVNTNYAWIDSEITLADDDSTIQTSDQRPLQGQSPYVLNFQLGYDDPDRNINAALLFNQFGERIVEVGVQGAPDIYEQPRPSLDFVYSQAWGPWKLKGKLRNILDPEVEMTQGNEVTRSIDAIGREISLGLEYSF